MIELYNQGYDEFLKGEMFFAAKFNEAEIIFHNLIGLH